MQEISLDRTDYRIIKVLEQQGRISNTLLAEQVNLSQSQCLRRLRQLEDTGVITSYKAVMNYEKLGFTVLAWTLVTVNKDTANARQKVSDFLQNLPAAVKVHGVTGDVDLMVEVVCRSMQEFSQIIVQQLYSHPDVVSTKSYLKLDTLKESGSPISE
ncbi:Lrp/AsnC family transcriptional regulator [Marinomonas epiphytica]